MERIIILSLLIFVAPTRAWFSRIRQFVEDSIGLELCNERYIYDHVEFLRSNMDRQLFGQHFVKEKLIAAVHSHIANEPKKALAISMHGWTGGGKSHVARIMMNSLYKYKEKSRFVHFFSGRLHFPRTDPNSLEQYKIDLQMWIKGNTSECPRSMFVFDEIDKIPSSVFDGIKPMLDYHTVINSVDYRKSIFIFISNLGGGTITRTYQELWVSGLRREEMEYRSFESKLRHTLYNSEGPYERSVLLRSHVVSLYLPFLPLEKEHLKKCIEVEVEAQRRLGHMVDLEDAIKMVFQNMEFYDDTFSTSGCKRVADQVALLAYTPRTEL